MTTRSAFGQGFTMVGNKTLNKVKFYLKRNGSPTGNLIVRVYAGELDGNGRIIPTDDPINCGILDESSLVAASTIGLAWGPYYEFTGFNLAMVNGIKYVIQVESYSGTFDDSNNVAVWFTNEAAGKEGNLSAYVDSVWRGYGYDCTIIVYDDIGGIIYQHAYNNGTLFYNSTLNGVHPDTLCPTEPEEAEEPELPKQHITDAITEWVYDYVFKHTPTEHIRGDVVKRIEETRQIKGRFVTRLFRQANQIKARIASKFEETSPMSSVILIKFAETFPVNCALIKRFEETKAIGGTIYWKFTLMAYAKILGETISIEKKYLEELEWL